MQLKLKFTDCRSTIIYNVDEKVQNYGQLRGRIAELVDTGLSFHLSLNYGKDIIRVNDETTFKDFGLVSGDILTVVICKNSSYGPEPFSTKGLCKTSNYMYRIMLCNESQLGAIPSTLEHLYLSQPVESKFDALVLVIHTLMSEVGFIQAEVDKSKSSLCKWKAMNGVYKMKYYDPACPSNYCQLICVALGENVLVVHAVVCDGPSKDTIMNVSFHCDNYLHKFSNKFEPKNVYRNLQNMSKCFKDVIAYPLMNIIHTDAGIPTKGDFMSLPVEVKLIILNYLDGRCLAMLSKVCTELNQLCNEDISWKKCFAREFPTYTSALYNTSESDWKKRYIEIYKELCKQKKKMKFARTIYAPTRRRLPFDLIDQDHMNRMESRRIIEGITPFPLGFPRFI